MFKVVICAPKKVISEVGSPYSIINCIIYDGLRIRRSLGIRIVNTIITTINKLLITL